MDNRPVGVFDSGVGGLTVLREISRQLPHEKVIYFGDTARVPYGDRDPMQVVDFSRQIVRFLRTHDVKAVVIACNTATAPSLPYLRSENDIPVIGVIEPGARGAVAATENGRIGVIATSGTIKSGQYPKHILEIDPSLEVFPLACPRFVPLIEAGRTHEPETAAIVHEYISQLTARDIDTLVLGCTHYPLLRDLIGAEAGDRVTLVDPARETAAELAATLDAMDGRASADVIPVHEYYVSGDPVFFRKFAEKVLPCAVPEAVKTDIEKY